MLRKGPLSVGIAPEAGGSLTHVHLATGSGRFDVLRPAVAGPVRISAALNMSSFVLIPYAGRLRAGCFEFEGRRIAYPLNASPERHSSHGDGFTRGWKPTLLQSDRAVLEILPQATAPIQYHATQTISVTEDRLEIRLQARNLERQRIPFEVGFHPYFAARSRARIRAQLPQQWNWDEELMPTSCERNLRQSDFARGMDAGQLPIAAEYSGWDGQALIEWPGDGISVRILTQPVLRHVVVWAPAAEEFFCFEPLSHATDSFNRTGDEAALNPIRALNPGEACEQVCTFLVDCRTQPALSPR